jgi:diguanylate cyclase (GGDEF)-like protein/PAS domain S-box-containing protein
VVALGSAIAAAGLGMSAAWLFHMERIVRLMPGFLMVFSTALGFAVVGAALVAGAIFAAARNPLHTGAGLAIAALGAVGLAQHLLGVSLGIDWPALHLLLPETSGTRTPGRMAAATGAAFMLAGAVLFLAPRARSRVQVVSVRIFTLAVVAIGVLTIVGYVLNFPEVIATYWLARVSLITSVLFILLGCALWFSWRDDSWNSMRLITSEDNRISLAGTAAVATSIAAAGIAVFWLMQANMERVLAQAFALSLRSRQLMVSDAIARSVLATRAVAERPNIRRLYVAPSADAADPNHPAFLSEVANSLLQSGFSAFAFYGLDGRELARAGEFIHNSELRLTVSADKHHAEILWDGKMALQDRADVVEAGRRVGEVRALHRLPELDQAIADAADLGKTAEFAVCGLGANTLQCAPTRFQPTPFEVPILPYKRLPMSNALEGHTGAAKSTDYRGKKSLATYSPLGSTGVGAVLKIDLTELYAPISDLLGYFVVTLLVASAAGGWLLRRSVRPLMQRVLRSEQRLRMALDGSQLALWDWDIAAAKMHLSDRWAAILGGAPKPTDTTPQLLAGLVHPDDVAMLTERLKALLEGTMSHYAMDHRVRGTNGEWRWIRSRGQVVERSRNGTALRATGTAVDIGERKNRELEITHLSQHDVLTGLPNRMLFCDRLDRALLRGRREKSLLAVMYIDVDKFKAVNDTLGHAAGDNLLVEFARRLSECVRAVDTVARVGGDEFAVVLEILSAREDGLRIARNVVAAMRPGFALLGRTASISASVGIAFHDGSRDISAAELTAIADQALYDAKRAGRDGLSAAA